MLYNLHKPTSRHEQIITSNTLYKMWQHNQISLQQHMHLQFIIFSHTVSYNKCICVCVDGCMNNKWPFQWPQSLSREVKVSVCKTFSFLHKLSTHETTVILFYSLLSNDTVTTECLDTVITYYKSEKEWKWSKPISRQQSYLYWVNCNKPRRNSVLLLSFCV